MAHGMTSGRMMLLSSASEASFRAWVIRYAKRAGWMVSSMHDSRKQTWGTDRGIPDLIIAGHGRLIFSELKKVGGFLRDDQKLWRLELMAAGCEYHCWNPLDEDEIKQVLGPCIDPSMVYDRPLSQAQGRAVRKHPRPRRTRGVEP